MDPLVSVVIPFYNEEKYIAKSVKSILRQTYKNLEILAVDDGSTDRSREIVSGLRDERMRVISNGRNLGRPAAKNVGIDQASGEYITFLDADDECDPRRVEKQLLLTQDGGPRTVSGTWVTVSTNGKEIVKELPVNHADIIKGFNRTFNRVTFVAGTIMSATQLLRQFKYQVKLKYFEDWDLLLRLSESGTVTFRNVPEPLYSYYIREKSTRLEKDWYDYNLFSRNCQDRRRKHQREFVSVEDFKSYLMQDRAASIYYSTLELMIRTRRKIAAF